MVDLIFVIYNAPSSGDLWNTSKELIRSFVQRVSVGTTGYQLGVVTYSDVAQLAIPLQSNASMFLSAVDQLRLAVGSGVNLRQALYVTRMTALAFNNGARPPAYQAVVLLWNGLLPGVPLTDEAPKLKQSGADVYIVTTSTYGSTSGTQQLATSIAAGANSIFVVGQTLSTSSISASIAVGITLDCLRTNITSFPPSTSTTTAGESYNSLYARTTHSVWYRGEARVSAVGVLKGVLSLQRIFSMVGEPIVERTHSSEY